LKSGKTICVDPGDGKVVEKFLDEKSLNLDFIIITHKHFDHVGGVKYLKKKYDCEVIIFQGDRDITAGGTIFVNLDEKFNIKSDNADVVDLNQVVSRETIKGDFKIGEINFRAFKTFGHCQNHISFYLPDEGVLFCGDTLFSSGCGRVFDGTHEDLFESLSHIASFPDKTIIYPTHEYTVDNIEFGLSIDGENEDLREKLVWARKLRAEGQPTLPTILENEKRTNVFLRCDSLDEFVRNRNAKDVW
jgi:hydroxyacylglutathione hydrolase